MFVNGENGYDSAQLSAVFLIMIREVYNKFYKQIV